MQNPGKLKWTVLAACLLFCAGLWADDAENAPAPAGLVLMNGAVYTVNPEQPWAEAVAVSDGVIRYVGDDAGVKAWAGPETRVVDLHGRMLLPGFQDGHAHPLWAGIDHEQCSLTDLTTAEQ